MDTWKSTMHGHDLCGFTCNTVIVGSGASAFSAANRLFSLGQEDLLLITEGIQMGTSRNTGSDKQTYYKLNLSGDGNDSVRAMAQTYVEGKCMDGDIALVEAACSARCFFALCEAGVPFPYNKYGEYVGYKTDHDVTTRATSAGPLTSRLITECLERKVKEKRIPILDGCLVIGLLVKDGDCIGLLAISKKDNRYVLVNALNVIYATGGSASIYADSVYPPSQTGSSGIALEAGAWAKNITEWQYGLASIKFRWNVSGTFQQVIPRYVSTAEDGRSDEREFLDEYFTDGRTLLEDIFLKGYQWPFDSMKVPHQGSSLIDVLVDKERKEKGRRVFLDFRRNPSVLGIQPDFSKLGENGYAYLSRSNAFQAIPIERLKKMNPQAIKLYEDHGIDLHTEMLEIAVCAQHNNGGLEGNIWWESNIRHLFPIGEANGSHGVYRPGGSALNAGQVGALRASEFIVSNYKGKPMDVQSFLGASEEVIKSKMAFGDDLLQREATDVQPVTLKIEIGTIMSRCCATIRSKDRVAEARKGLAEVERKLRDVVTVKDPHLLFMAYQVYDILVVSKVLVFAINDYIEHDGGSRGSYIIGTGDVDDLHFDGGTHDGLVQETMITQGVPVAKWREVRPIPARDLWFENVWKEYLQHVNA